VRVGCLRRRATGVPEEWPSRAAHVAKAASVAPYRTRLTGRLISERARWDDRRALASFGAALKLPKVKSLVGWAKALAPHFDEEQPVVRRAHHERRDLR